MFYALVLMTAIILATAPAVASTVAGDPLPRITCPPGYEASVYAEGLSSPDGLAFAPDGVLYVAEETAGQVSRVDPNGIITPVIAGLDSPEGIAFDQAGNLYVVEDVENGRLLCVDPGGGQEILAADRDAPEGVVWSHDGYLYITESNVQFTDNLEDMRTRVTRVSQGGEVAVICEDIVPYSYSGITLGADGLLYVSNETSMNFFPESVFQVTPVISGARTLFVSDLVAPEGQRFAPGGGFPLYVVEEDLGDGQGRVSVIQADGTHQPFCTGFYAIEDVALDGYGNLYVSEDTTGTIVKIIHTPQYRVFLPFVAREKP